MEVTGDAPEVIGDWALRRGGHLKVFCSWALRGTSQENRGRENSERLLVKMLSGVTPIWLRSKGAVATHLRLPAAYVLHIRCCNREMQEGSAARSERCPEEAAAKLELLIAVGVCVAEAEQVDDPAGLIR